MIVVKATLLQATKGGEPLDLGELRIWNVGGNKQWGTYNWTLTKKGGKGIVSKEGTIQAFPRLKLLAWDLILRILFQAYGERNNLVEQR